METLLDILAAAGVGAAAGLAPFVALATVVLLAVVHVGVNPAGSDFNFLDDVVPVVIAAIVLVQSILADLSGNLKLRIAADHRLHVAVHIVIATAMGALAGLVMFAASDQPRVIGAVIGGASAAFVAWGGSNFFGRVSDRVKRQREADKAKGKEKGGDAGAIALAVDLLTVAAVALAMIVPPAGLVLPLLVLITLLGRRRKQQQKYEGLRSLR